MPYYTITQKWMELNVTSRWGARRGDALYHRGIDHNGDGVIDIIDVNYFAANVGNTIFVQDVDAEIVIKYHLSPYQNREDIINAAIQKVEAWKAEPPTEEEKDAWRREGDVNQDGVVDQIDLDLINQSFGWVGPPGTNPADVNNDGTVNILDINICAKNQGRDLLYERQFISLDYPIAVKHLPGYYIKRGEEYVGCEELHLTLYGSPIAPVVIFIIALVLAGFFAATTLWFAWETYQRGQRLAQVQNELETVATDLDDLYNRVAADPNIPPETKEALLKNIADIKEGVWQAYRKAADGGDPSLWVDIFWQVMQALPLIVIVAVVVIIGLPLLERFGKAAGGG